MPRGFDGAKKVDGVKRHVLIDTTGVLIAVVVTPADVQDRVAFPALLCKAKRIVPTIAHVWWTRATPATSSPRLRARQESPCRRKEK